MGCGASAKKKSYGAPADDSGNTQPTSDAVAPSVVLKNSAFVFVKPNAMTDAFKLLVQQTLQEAQISILAEGDLTGEEIDDKKLVDQHYYSIASKATLLKPQELNVPREKFKDAFGVDWSEVLENGLAFNAVDACEHLGVSVDEMDALWQRSKASGSDWAKLGGGFQCARLSAEGREPIFAFNGFFMAMRAKFTQPGPAIHYYVVEWDPSVLSWADFRGKLLGATDPAAASEQSLRGRAARDWEALGLGAKPWIGENAIHASASPIEALAERCNWLARSSDDDDFGKALIGGGVPKAVLEAWRRDPQVALADGGRASLFDQLEDTDAGACLQRCAELAKLQT